jgi:serine/threonine protein kinase
MESVAEFGPYTLIEAIARSPSAVSFLAGFRPAADGERFVALKFLRAHLSQEPGFAERLVEEVRVAARLNHVNVAQTFDLGRWDERLYAVLEFVDGVPLATLLDRLRTARRAAPADVAAFVLSEICAALGYAHTRRDERGQPLPVCHGDVRPRAVLLSFGGEVKLVDYGVARTELALGGERALRLEDRLQFCAPEVAAGADPSPASDVFSAAATAYCLLTGRRLYEGTSGAELLARARRCEFTRPREIDPSIPEELEALLLGALSADPAARGASATELRNQSSSWLRRTSPGFGRHRLKAFLQKELGDLVPPAGTEPERRPLQRKEFVAADADSLLAASADHVPRVAPTAGQWVLREESAALDAPFSSAPTGAAAAAKGALPVPSARPGPVVTPRTTQPKKPVSRPAIGSGSTEAAPDAATQEAGEAVVDTASSRTRSYLPSILTDPDLEPDAPGAVPEDDEVPASHRFDPDAVAGAVYDDSVDADFVRSTAREARSGARSERSFTSALVAAVVLGGMLAGGAWFGWTRYQAALAGAQSGVARAPSVFVTSRPQGAQILVDGVETGLTTPAPITGLSAGAEVAVSVRLPGYDAPQPQTARVEAGSQAQVLLALAPSEHRVRIDSDPAGAAIIRDGAVVGTTPAAIGPLRVDYRDGADFVVRLDGYFDERVAVDWEAGAAESSVRVALRPDPNWVAPEPEAAQP